VTLNSVVEFFGLLLFLFLTFASQRLKEENAMTWYKFDPKEKAHQPPEGMLVALRLDPKDKASVRYGKETYDIGRFQRDARNPASRKQWWHGASRLCDPVEMRKHYDIRWCPVPEYDGP